MEWDLDREHCLFRGRQHLPANPPNNCVYINVGAAGTSGSTPPIFPAIPGFSVNDGPDIIWYCISGFGYPFAETFPIGQSTGTALTQDRLAYLFVFDPLPAKGTNIQILLTGDTDACSSQPIRDQRDRCARLQLQRGVRRVRWLLRRGEWIACPIRMACWPNVPWRRRDSDSTHGSWRLTMDALLAFSFAWSVARRLFRHPQRRLVECTTNGAGGAVRASMAHHRLDLTVSDGSSGVDVRRHDANLPDRHRSSGESSAPSFSSSRNDLGDHDANNDSGECQPQHQRQRMAGDARAEHRRFCHTEPSDWAGVHRPEQRDHERNTAIVERSDLSDAGHDICSTGQ